MTETLITDERMWPEVAQELKAATGALREAQDRDDLMAVVRACYRVLSCLARQAYDKDVHGEIEVEEKEGMSREKVEINRKLKAVIRYHFAGSAEAVARRFVTSALKHAMNLSPKKIDSYGKAARSLTATTAVVNMVTLALGGRLD